MLIFAFSSYPAVLQWKDVDILIKILRHQQIHLYILKLNCVLQLDIIKSGNLYNRQTLQRKVLVILLIATPLVRMQQYSFISWHIIIKIFLQIQPCFLQSSRLIIKFIAISTHRRMGTGKGYNSPQYFVLKALVQIGRAHV